MSKTSNNLAASHELTSLAGMLRHLDATDVSRGLRGAAVARAANEASLIPAHQWTNANGRTWATRWTQRLQKLKHPVMTQPHDPNDSDML